MSQFSEQLRWFAEKLGEGSIVGKVEVDQVYAHYQHEHPEFKHPRGGKAFFLRDSLLDNTSESMLRLAERAITENGPKLVDAMKDNMEVLTRRVYEQSPVEFGDLRDSGHPTVTQNGEVKYDRAPRARRLSEQELREKGKLRNLMNRS